eukprot:jgi/Mesvir1/5859/Mv00648-RA.2
MAVRQVVRPYHDRGLITVVDDPDGSCDALLVCNLVSPMAGPLEDASFGLPLTHVFILLEPAYVFCEEMAYPLIRIDHSGHIIPLNRPDGPLPASLRLPEISAWLRDTFTTSWPLAHVTYGPLEQASPSGRAVFLPHHHTAEDWRNEGNAAFKDGRVYDAVVRYTRGLEQHPRDPLLRSNRAAALLAFGEPLLAARDAEAALEADPCYLKASFRLAMALYQLQAYERAIGILEGCLGLVDVQGGQAAGMPESTRSHQEVRSERGRKGFERTENGAQNSVEGNMNGERGLGSHEKQGGSTGLEETHEARASSCGGPAEIRLSTHRSHTNHIGSKPAAELRELLAKCRAVTDYGVSGMYDFPSLVARHRSSTLGRHAKNRNKKLLSLDDDGRLDLAGYAHPSLKPAFIPSKGCRGVITHGEIEPGTLLLACKALGLSRGAPASVTRGMGRDPQGACGGVDVAGNAHCRWQVAQSALAGGRGADVLCWLFGAEQEARMDVDMATGRLLRSKNERPRNVTAAPGCVLDGRVTGPGGISRDGGMREGSGAEGGGRGGTWQVSPIDIERVYEGSARCIFTVDRDPGGDPARAHAAVQLGRGGGGGACSPLASSGGGQVGAENPGGSGFFPTSSLFNHSCVPNATYFFLGDIMLVSATTRVAAGEEVTLSYKGGFGAHLVGDERRLLEKAWGFRCRCPLCGHHARHEALYKRAASALRSARGSLEEACQVVALLTEIGPPLEVTVAGVAARPHLAAGLYILAGHLAEAGRAREAVAAIEEGLRLCPPESPCAYFFATTEDLDATNMYSRLADLQMGLGMVGAAARSMQMGRTFGERMYSRAFPAIAGLV